MGLRRFTTTEASGARAMARSKLSGGQESDTVVDDIAAWLVARAWKTSPAVRRASDVVRLAVAERDGMDGGGVYR